MRPISLSSSSRAAACALALLASAACAGRAAAAPMISLVDSVGNPNATTIAPGGSFTTTVRLAADQPFIGYSIYLTDPGFTSAARFTISNRTSLSTNPFTDPTKSNATFNGDPVDAATNDLGYTAVDAASVGTYDLMTVTFTAATNLASGTYAINFRTGGTTGSVVTTSSFAEVTPGATNYSVTVAPAPEPATLATLAGVGGVALIRRRRR